MFASLVLRLRTEAKSVFRSNLSEARGAFEHSLSNEHFDH
jgi:hypothetical protein